MSNASDGYEDEYEEYDEFDEEEDERGLSGFVVLMMGVVMLGAFFSVVWVAYQQGIDNGRKGIDRQTPYVAADPEPVKIETAQAPDVADDREVYDVFDGADPEPVTVLAEGPEEPVDRSTGEDAVGALAAEVSKAAAATSQEVEDRLASLAQQDAEVLDAEPEVTTPAPTVTAPSLASVTKDAPAQNNSANASAVNAMSGSHLVQVGAFGSNSEATQNWSRMQARMGGFLDGKAIDVERADLGARGVYHRLRIGPFATADEAKTYCIGLKERGQDCLVKAKS